MVRVPIAEQAVLELGKLVDYCLNADHPRGRHKARIFRQTLGVTRDDAAWLRQLLLDGVRESEAAFSSESRWGREWRVDIAVARHGRLAVVRTIWIVRRGETAPRFVTCWVL